MFVDSTLGSTSRSRYSYSIPCAALCNAQCTVTIVQRTGLEVSSRRLLKGKTSSILFAGLLERAILPEATGRCKRLETRLD